MEFQAVFPVWDKLTKQQQDRLLDSLITRSVKKGTVLHNGNMDCTGLLLIQSGQLRAYMLSEEGREITLYRLFDMDMCLFSASCIMRSIQFEVTIEAERTRTSGSSRRRYTGGSWRSRRRWPTTPTN